MSCEHDLQVYKNAVPTCKEHTPAGEIRMKCVLCTIEELTQQYIDVQQDLEDLLYGNYDETPAG